MYKKMARALSLISMLNVSLAGAMNEDAPKEPTPMQQLAARNNRDLAKEDSCTEKCNNCCTMCFMCYFNCLFGTNAKTGISSDELKK